MFSLDQYNAAHQAAALIDRSARGKIVLTGADRAAFLHALLTNDISRLTPGSGVYAAYLTPQGRMISDLRIVETGPEMLLDVAPSVGDALSERLDQLVFSEDVQIRNATRELAEIGVHGPLAAKALEQAVGVPAARLESLNEYDNVRAPGSSTTIVRDSVFGMAGFDVYLPMSGRGPLVDALMKAGAVPMDADTIETLRIEAGRPKFAVDMDTDTIPLEAGIEDRAISMTKGCYVGQEVIVRVTHRGGGRVAKKLVRWVADASADIVPLPESRIFSYDPSTSLTAGKDIGRVTSAAFSPNLNRVVGLGYVHRDFTESGTDVTVMWNDSRIKALVQ